MTRAVITVPEDAPLEEAASIMADRRIGSLLIMQGKALVGIITESDLFRVLLELLGGRRFGVRITAAVADQKGMLAKITNAVFDSGGDIVGLGIREAAGAGKNRWEVMLKVQDVPQNKLVEAIRPVADEIMNVREI